MNANKIATTCVLLLIGLLFGILFNMVTAPPQYVFVFVTEGGVGDPLLTNQILDWEFENSQYAEVTSLTSCNEMEIETPNKTIFIIDEMSSEGCIVALLDMGVPYYNILRYRDTASAYSDLKLILDSKIKD